MKIMDNNYYFKVTLKHYQTEIGDTFRRYYRITIYRHKAVKRHILFNNLKNRGGFRHQLIMTKNITSTNSGINIKHQIQKNSGTTTMITNRETVIRYQTEK